MSTNPVLLAYDDLHLYARQFEVGANTAAQQSGISVVIDVFRASNTMLELIDAGATVFPVTSVDNALKDKYSGYIRVGEDEGEILSQFDYDNSPVSIHRHKPDFKGRDVVIRTTNGTRGIISAVGAREIVVGTFRNFSAVVEYCLSAIHDGIPVSFIGMGTLEETRIEDRYCAKMFVVRVLEKLGRQELVDKLNEAGDNPWVRNWREEIMSERGDNLSKLDDYRFSLELDTTDLIPAFDPETGKLIALQD